MKLYFYRCQLYLIVWFKDELWVVSWYNSCVSKIKNNNDASQIFILVLDCLVSLKMRPRDKNIGKCQHFKGKIYGLDLVANVLTTQPPKGALIFVEVIFYRYTCTLIKPRMFLNLYLRSSFLSVSYRIIISKWWWY